MSNEKRKPFDQTITGAIALAINQSKSQMGAMTLGGIHNLQSLLADTEVPEDKIDELVQKLEEFKTKTSNSDILEVLEAMIKDLRNRKSEDDLE